MTFTLVDGEGYQAIACFVRVIPEPDLFLYFLVECFLLDTFFVDGFLVDGFLVDGFFVEGFFVEGFFVEVDGFLLDGFLVDVFFVEGFLPAGLLDTYSAFSSSDIPCHTLEHSVDVPPCSRRKLIQLLISDGFTCFHRC